MSEKLPYVQLNLPNHHLPVNGPDHEPFSARYSEEIGRRRNRRSGSLVYEQQASGLEVASTMLSGIESGIEDEDNFAARMLAMAGINSSWYMFARGSDVMSRRLVLPKLVEQNEDGLSRETRQGLIEKCSQGMLTSAILANRYFETYLKCKEGERARGELGRTLGNTSLSLACLDVVDTTAGMDAFEAQDLARRRSIKLLEEARGLADEIGSYPSMAQLADEKSDLVVHWKRRAPNKSYQLLQYAMNAPSQAEGLFGKGHAAVN